MTFISTQKLLLFEVQAGILANFQNEEHELHIVSVITRLFFASYLYGDVKISFNSEAAQIRELNLAPKMPPCTDE